MILCEPVSRELSAYNHRKFVFNGLNWQASKMNLAKNYTSFDEFVNKEIFLRLTRQASSLSFYSAHLKQWFDVLKRDQILI